MGQHRRFAVALLAAALAGLTGCHSFPSLAGYSPMGANAAPGNSPTAGNGPFPAGLDANAAAAKQRPLKQMQGTQSESVDTYLAAAQQMENSGKWAEAIAYYEIVRQLDPRKTLFCARHLAVLYDRKDDFDKAIDEYAFLLKANPKDSAAYNDFGYGYYCRGKFDAAEQKLRKAVELDPKNALAWSNLGMALAQLNRYDESLSAFEKTAQKNGTPLTRAQALCNLAFIQASQRKWVEARDSYALALKEEPGMQKAFTMLQRINEEILNGDKRGRDERKRARELERLAALDPEITKGIPFGFPTGAVGADGGMIMSSRDAGPIHAPTRESLTPPVGARTQPAVAPAPQPQSAVQLPLIPSTLEVD
jgi:Tfp pilus assembly protein PilF